MEKTDLILGFKGLEKFTGMKHPLIKRKISYYGFPLPQIVKRRHTAGNNKFVLMYAWNKNEVEAWLNKKEEYVGSDRVMMPPKIYDVFKGHPAAKRLVHE